MKAHVGQGSLGDSLVPDCHAVADQVLDLGGELEQDDVGVDDDPERHWTSNASNIGS